VNHPHLHGTANKDLDVINILRAVDLSVLAGRRLVLHCTCHRGRSSLVSTGYSVGQQTTQSTNRALPQG
jgi:alpha-D-ribose 1-methylphosphonate 5-triphosphate synthase subunit PhnL